MVEPDVRGRSGGQGRSGGAWRFKGTRVPVRALVENLAAGATIDDFVAWFPGVTREQAMQAKRRLNDDAEAAK